jgi:pyruvate-formate lyase-activating enzyme
MAITTLGLVLGYQCNIRCRHCLWGETLNDKTRMTAEDACRYIDQANELGSICIVGFTGGEAFIFKNVMKEAMYHAAYNYGLPSCIGTNSSWATSKDKALSLLDGYYQIGLRRLQLSVDDYHQEWVPLERVKYAIEAANELGIRTTLVCIVDEGTKSLKEYVELLEVAQHELVEMTAEAPVTPVGFAAERISKRDLPVLPDVPSNWCSMLDVVNILPDGSVQLCCGAPFSLKSLKAGNAKENTLKDILASAELNPVFNALAVAKGPRILAETLHEAGEDSFLKRGCYASSCDACQHIMRNERAISVLYDALEDRKDELYVDRYLQKGLLDDIFSEYHSDSANSDQKLSLQNESGTEETECIRTQG